MRVESLLPAPVKMSSVQEHLSSYKSSALLDEMRIIGESQLVPGSRKVLNSDLWHACAGPLVTLPQPGTLVYYFPQGHSEQVTASTRKAANSHIPNYPNLPSQLLCKVNDVTQHADKETDEIYAQITLQPVNSEVDASPVQDLGYTKCKQPSEFFCKNLTASDTSTHGGFSVPRRAAEKLFPQLDYSMQPPNQELIVRDLHDNLWTFRHIYRGQPRRHLLTTGWSLFVGTKRLKAGDSVLFIRDEKSQLLLGVRRTNRQPTALPSSVLSADSMHIGVLAAAAHAAASRSPFTVYFNPRACPSEFIIPLAKYHKALYTQVSIGMRFGMMFETEESTKRRYMGTIVGISEFDPLRWSHSKWRNLQVEWDENGYGERPDRVSLWEIDTPESLFVFPSPSFKRQCLPGFVVSGGDIGFTNTKYLSQAPEKGIGDVNPMAASLGSEQLLKMLLTPQIPYPNNQLGCNQSIYATILQKISGNNSSTTFASTSPPFGAMRSSLCQDVLTKPAIMQQIKLPLVQQPILSSQNTSLQSTKLVNPQEQIIAKDWSDQSKIDTTSGATMSGMELSDKDNEKSIVNPPQNENHVAPINEDQLLQTKRSKNIQLVQPATTQSSRQERSDLSETNGLNISPANQNYHPSQYIGNEEWMLHPLCYQPFTSPLRPPPGSLCSSGIQDSIFLPASDYGTSSIVNSETFNPFETFQFPCISDPHTPQFLPSYVQEVLSAPELNLANEEVVGSGTVDEEIGLYKASNPCGVKDLSDENNYQSETYCNIQFEVNNRNMLTSSCVSSTVVDGFGIERESSFHVPSEDLFSNFASNQDIQSQVTSTSLTDSQLLSLQDIPDASSGSMDINDCSFLNRCSMRRVGKQHLRTYTKVQKLGSVGRSIDVTRFKDYHELVSAIACMFGLEGQLDDPRGSEWKLVYVDYENDVLLVGDDPWEEFVNCVRCIRILSPSEVQQMSEEGVHLMNSHIAPCP